MAKFKAKIAKSIYDAMDETAKSFYVQLTDPKTKVVDPNNYVFDGVESVEGWGFEYVAGLKSALGAERENAAAAANLQKEFEGLDLTKVKAAWEQFKNSENWTPTEKAAAREAQIVAKHQTELQARDSRIAALTGEVGKALIDSEVARCCAAAGPTPGASDLVVNFIRSQGMAKVVEKDGKFETLILGPDGKTPRITNKSGSTANMGLEELLLELREHPTVGRAFDKPQKQNNQNKPAGRGDEGFVDRNKQTPDDSNPVERLTEFRRSQAANGKA